jgi:hypothetical protein
MPSPIEDLKRRLAESVRVLAPEGRLFSLTGIEKMRERVERIRREIGDRPSKPSADRICGALHKMRLGKPAMLDGAEFFFVCWGLTTRCGNQSVLMDDDSRFTEWMAEVERRRPTTLAWQGLLDAYFRYERVAEQAMGEKNWGKLRGWLEQDLAGLRKRTPAGMLPLLPWLNTLIDQRNLLGNNPCRPYAEEALRGEQGRIDRIKADLGIPQTSWFWRELVFSQIEEAVGWREDARFKHVLDTLLAQLMEHPVLRDKGLAKLLTRYAKCTNKEAHEGLKQFAVKPEREGGWGSPQLAQQAKWGLVEPSVKAMVSQWLVLEDLEDFFERLQAGGLADTRRLVFWKRFIKQISYSHVALSSHLWWSRQPNWVEFKQKKLGRISRLDGGGGAKNAFIMKIGEYYFIEFSETGDACYGYRVGSEPFRLGSGQLKYPEDLKDKSKRVFWGSHNGDLWEVRFLNGSGSQPGLSDLGIRI